MFIRQEFNSPHLHLRLAAFAQCGRQFNLIRAKNIRTSGGIGIHAALKMLCSKGMWVRLPPGPLY